MLTSVSGTKVSTVNQTNMLTLRAVSRFVAHLMVGVLVFAQMALAAHACPLKSGQAGDAAGGMSAMGANGVAAPGSVGHAVDSGADESPLQNLCAAHCESGQQSADSEPAPNPPVALLASLYRLPMLEHGGVNARRVEIANDSPADPPHAILHCCLRI